MLARYRGKTTCYACGGKRLRPEANYVRMGGKSISDLVSMPISDLVVFFDNLSLNAYEQKVAERLLKEIHNRLHYLLDVGLGYLTLNRKSNSLSGGESQRINLATPWGAVWWALCISWTSQVLGYTPKIPNALSMYLKHLETWATPSLW